MVKEQELQNILKFVLQYKSIDKIEQLTYLAGCSMECLKELGCPVNLEELIKTVDIWANKQQKPIKKDDIIYIAI